VKKVVLTFFTLGAQKARLLRASQNQ